MGDESGDGVISRHPAEAWIVFKAACVNDRRRHG
jgi:hypothetical protein